MTCNLCATPLFTWEQPVGLCRAHGTEGHVSHRGVTVPRTDGTAEQEPDYRTDRLRSLMVLGTMGREPRWSAVSWPLNRLHSWMERAKSSLLHVPTLEEIRAVGASS